MTSTSQSLSLWESLRKVAEGTRDCAPESALQIGTVYHEAKMGKLTGTRHGDAANKLMAFYMDKVHELEESGQYFMAAVALGFALETAVLTYLLVEFGEENGGELEIPDSVNMSS